MEGFIGNREAIEAVNRALESGRLPHALIFIGPEGVGKYTAASAFAAKVVGAPFVVGEAFSHPDVSFIAAEAGSANITIAQARALRRFLAHTPLVAEKKAAVVDGVDAFTQEAANALLKILEEPSEKTVLFLMTHDVSRVLPTIRSRAVAVRFTSVSSEELLSGLHLLGFPRTRMAEIASFAEGKPAFAVRFLQDPEFFGRIQKQREGAQCVLSRERLSQFVFLAKLEQEDPSALRELPSLWLRFGRDALGARVSEGRAATLTNFLRRCFVADNLLRTTNAQPRLVLTNLLYHAKSERV